MKTCETQIKVYLLDEENRKVFGDGPYRLLKGVERTGSLRKAAMEMEMAYSKAHKILKTAEDSLGMKLVTAKIGGSLGGGSELTPGCKLLLERFAQYKNALNQANEQIYHQIFQVKKGCVIMASGQGRRFGSNKLMTPFKGKPMIQYVLDATADLFDRRVVVTRHESVAEYCKEKGVEYILHDKPLRSDTVRIGIEALEKDVDVCTFCAADQPLLERSSLQNMLLLAGQNPSEIYRMSFAGQMGNPVTFPESLFQELKELPEGKGGIYLLEKYKEKVKCISASRLEELSDVDTHEDLKKLNNC